MQKLKKLFSIATSCFKLGEGISDKIRLFGLYLKYPLVNRGLAEYKLCKVRFQVGYISQKNKNNKKVYTMKNLFESKLRKSKADILQSLFPLANA